MKEGEQSNLNGERIGEKVGEPNDSHEHGALTAPRHAGPAFLDRAENEGRGAEQSDDRREGQRVCYLES
jgi:hypothetical protein